MEQTSTPKLLVAVSQHDMQIVNDVLRKEFHFVCCHTFDDAKRHLDASIGVIVCGVHFDGGKMFDLLRLVRGAPEYRHIPFIIGLGRDRGYTAAILAGIEAAARSLGATAFINMLELRSRMSQEAAYDVIRRQIRQHLAPGSSP